MTFGEYNTYEGRKVSKVVMCEVRSREKKTKNKPKEKRKYSDKWQKEMDSDEPHPTPNEKTQSIQWTERPSDAKWCIGGRWFALAGGVKV